jgi:hypothetical protein
MSLGKMYAFTSARRGVGKKSRRGTHESSACATAQSSIVDAARMSASATTQETRAQ